MSLSIISASIFKDFTNLGFENKIQPQHDVQSAKNTGGLIGIESKSRTLGKASFNFMFRKTGQNWSRI